MAMNSILPLAAGDEPCRHVRVSGDVLDGEQQLFGPVNIARDLPRAQRHDLVPLGGRSRVTSESSIGWSLVRRAAQSSGADPAMFHLAIADFVKEPAFNRLRGGSQIRRERRIHAQDAQPFVEHRQRLRTVSMMVSA